MVKITASIDFWGSHFQPGTAEQLTGILFTQKNEVGDIGKIGRYKHQPIPYGSASFEAPKTVESSSGILWLAQQWATKLELVRRCGAETIHLNVAYYYDDQCNCELSVEEIQAIHILAIPYLFSVYQIGNLDEIP